MEAVMEFLKAFNIQTILSLAVIVGIFSANLKSEIKLLEAKIDRQAERSDRLYEMFIDLLKEKNNGK